MKHILLSIGLLLSAAGLRAELTYLEQISVETFAKMREVERFQIKVAEKFYLKGEFKAAASEYEKFLTLYERSTAAPYAQLMWSHCLLKQRKVYTAIKDGFQSVVDYWPESHEAMLAGFLIGRSYQSAGELQNAEKAYARTIAVNPKHYTSVLAKWELTDIYRVRKDQVKRVKIWEDLAYKTTRTKENSYYTTQSANYLGQHHFYVGNFPEALKAFETTYKGLSLVRRLYQYGGTPISTLTGTTKKAATGAKMADELIAFIRKQIPPDPASERNAAVTREYFYTIAAVHSRARRDKEGLDVYIEAAGVLGLDDDLRGKQAGWHAARKRYTEARRIYGQYIDREAGLAAIAKLWVTEKKWNEAINTYNQLIGLNKEKEGQWQQAIAGVWREAKDWDKAIATYQTLLTVEPGKFGDWYWAIADCYERSGRLKEAIRSYQQSDKYPNVYFAMASCHRRVKQYKEALVLYHQARADHNTAAQASIQIAYTYEQSGGRENAIKWFQQTCKLYPKTSHASQAHAHLQTKYKISVTLGGANENK